MEASGRIQRTGDDETTIARPYFARLPPAVEDSVDGVGEFNRRSAWINEEVNAPRWLTGAHQGAVGVERLEYALVRRKDVSAGPWEFMDRRDRFRRVRQLGGQHAEMREDVPDPSPA